MQGRSREQESIASDILNEEFSVPKAILSGVVAGVTSFAVFEGMIAYPAMIYHFDAPSIYPIINEIRSQYINNLPEYTKLAGVMGSLMGVIGFFDYRRLLYYGITRS